MQDAWRAYMELALGLTEASRKRATKVVKGLVGKGGATAEQLQALAEDLARTSTANREALTKLVRYELDRALGVVGLATSEEIAELRGRIGDLEQQLRRAEMRAAAAAGAPEPLPAAAVPAVTEQTVAKRAVAKQTVAKRAVAKKAVARQAVPKKAVAKRAVAKKAVAGQAVPKKAAGKNAGRDAGTGAG